MEVRQALTLVTIAELGSISKAGEKLHLTPAAIHKQLKALEGSLGLKLYEKRGQGIQLTDGGKLVLPFCRSLVTDVQCTMDAVNEWKGLKRGTVKIGAGPTISTYLLPPLLRLFRKEHPEIQLIVETGNSDVLMTLLVNGAIDLALIIASEFPMESDFSSVASWEIEYVIVTALSSIPASCALRELDSHPFILFRKGSRSENLIDRYLKRNGINPKVIMTFDNANSIKAMILAELGVSILPFWVVAEHIEDGSLSLIAHRERPLLSQMELIRRRTNYTSPALQSFETVARNFEFRDPPVTSGAMSS